MVAEINMRMQGVSQLDGSRCLINKQTEVCSVEPYFCGELRGMEPICRGTEAIGGKDAMW